MSSVWRASRGVARKAPGKSCRCVAVVVSVTGGGDCLVRLKGALCWGKGVFELAREISCSRRGIVRDAVFEASCNGVV